MAGWQDALRGDPLPWLLDRDAPAVRHLALRQLLDLPTDDPDVAGARAAAMRSDPIAGILAAQDPEGWWVEAGPRLRAQVHGHGLAADLPGPDGRRRCGRRGWRAACEYVLSHTQTAIGGFGASSVRTSAAATLGRHPLPERQPAAGADRVRLARRSAGRAIDRLAGGGDHGGGERCRSIDLRPRVPASAAPRMSHLPCAWGATKAVLGLAAIPVERRAPRVRRALDAGVEFLLSCDPSTAAYPMPSRATRPNGSWFRLGFPSGYVADVLQVIEAVCDAGAAGDPRLEPAVEWLLDAAGRSRAVGESLRLPGQAGARHRRFGGAEPVGHAARVPRAQGGGRGAWRLSATGWSSACSGRCMRAAPRSTGSRRT